MAVELLPTAAAFTPAATDATPPAAAVWSVDGFPPVASKNAVAASPAAYAADPPAINTAPANTACAITSLREVPRLVFERAVSDVATHAPVVSFQTDL
ncbi:hypothetical protein P3T40_001870 [Paraburkholderia sp. EB58]|jgi:hypothetical protein